MHFGMGARRYIPSAGIITVLVHRRTRKEFASRKYLETEELCRLFGAAPSVNFTKAFD